MYKIKTVYRNVVDFYKNSKLATIGLLGLIFMSGMFAYGNFINPPHTINSNQTQIFLFGETPYFYPTTFGITIQKNTTINFAIMVNRNFSFEGYIDNKPINFNFTNNDFMANNTYFFTFYQPNQTFDSSHPLIQFFCVNYDYNATNIFYFRHSFGFNIQLV